MSKDIEAQRRRHVREKSVIDHLAKDLYKPKPAPDENKSEKSPTISTGLSIEDQIRKKWDPTQGRASHLPPMMRVGAATKPPRIKKPSLLRGGFRGYVPTDADRAASIAVRRRRAQQRTTDLMPVINEIRKAGITSAVEIARQLTDRGIPTPRGSSAWTAVQVRQLLRTG